MIKIYISIALSFLIISNSANAQFGGLLNQLKDQLTDAINSTNTPQKAPAPPQVVAPTPPKVNTPAPPIVNESSPNKTASTNSACEQGEKLLFSCKVKGEPLNYCFSETGGVRGVTGKIKLEGKDISFWAIDLRDSGEKPPYANVQQIPSNIDGRDLFSTVYITVLDNTTYSITECGGLRCGILRDRPWFTVFKGSKKVSNNYCDEDSVTESNFNYKMNNKGKVVNDGLYREQKTKLDFSPPDLDLLK